MLFSALLVTLREIRIRLLDFQAVFIELGAETSKQAQNAYLTTLLYKIDKGECFYLLIFF